MNPDDPLEQLKALKAQQTDPLDELKATKPHNKPKIGQMGHAITTDESDEGGEPGIGTKTLGALAALDRDIPGAEAAQAGIRSVIRGQSYEQARNDIRGAEDAAPLAATLPARLLGGGLSAAAGGRALGLGAKGAGVLYGGLAGLGDSAPMSKDDRVGNTIAGAAIGGLAGAAGQKAAGIGRRVMAPVLRGGTNMLRQALDAAPAITKTLEGIALPAEVLRPPPAVAAKLGAPTLDTNLQNLLAAVKVQNEAQGIHEVGNGWGDAEEAMGLAPHQQPDLEALLRASLKMVKPRTPNG